MHMDTQAPWITNWWWGTATTSNVSLYIQVADNAAGVRNATVKVSTSTGGYNNWRDYGWTWDAGANAYRTDINPNDFQHWGCNYRAQLYMWDNAGNGGYINQSGDVAMPMNHVFYWEEGTYALPEGANRIIEGSVQTYCVYQSNHDWYVSPWYDRKVWYQG